MNMAQLKVKDKGCVLAINAKGEVRTRLIDMGLIKGTSFEVLRKAPLGDPLEIYVRGFLLTLRLQEAKAIEVTKVEVDGDG